MPVEIPLRNDLPFFSAQVVLDDVTYTFKFRWNARMGAWFMDILDEGAENLIAAGIRLVANFPIESNITGREPPGFFILEDTSGEGLEAGLTDLGQRLRLLYFTAADQAEFLG